MYHLYEYTIYATGYKKHIDEFIMFLTETAASVIQDSRLLTTGNVRKIIREKSIVYDVIYDEYRLEDIYKDNTRILQTMKVSQHPTYKITLYTLLPIRDDRVIQAKGIVDASRFYRAKGTYFEYPMNSKTKTYTIYCSQYFNSIYSGLRTMLDTEHYTFPTRPDYVLRNCFLTDQMYLHDHNYFRISDLVFIHKIKLDYSTKFLNVNFKKEYVYLQATQTDFIYDIDIMLRNALKIADNLYYAYKHPELKLNPLDLSQPYYISSTIYNEYVRLIFTSHLRPESPNTYHDIGGIWGRDFGPVDCITTSGTSHITNYPNIRISKKVLNNSYTNSEKYLFNYKENIIKFALEYFLSTAT